MKRLIDILKSIFYCALSISLIVSISCYADLIFPEERPIIQDLMQECNDVWHGGFKMYPSVWEEPEYP